jgi:radical SAM superfamily enzyme YgiQ (UPF0313 family)
MKFLLVTTQKKNFAKLWFCQTTTPFGSILPPVDLASIAAVVREKGHEPRILDLRLFENPLEVYENELEKFRPDAVIMNITTASAYEDYELLSKTPRNIKKICFGTHAWTFPEECFNSGVDFILSGDPEAGIENLLENDMNALLSPGVFTRESLNKMEPAYIEDLDTLPYPAIDLLDVGKYHTSYFKHRFTVLLGARYCPFSCTFCFYTSFWGRKPRKRSVENVVGEMEFDMKKFGVSEFLFLDPTFNVSEESVIKFCNEILDRKLNVSWACSMRVTPVSKKMLDQMKRAGCNVIFYGVEDPDLLKEVKKITLQQTIDAFKKTKEARIKTIAFLMLFPRDDLTDKEYEEKMMSLLKKLDIDGFQVELAIPHPGTEWYDQLKKKGGLSDNWSDFDPGGIKLPYQSNLDLVKIKRKIYLKYPLKNPKFLFNVLSQTGARNLGFLLPQVLRLFFGK